MTKFYKLIILILSLLFSGAALAATSVTTMDITASVGGTCSVSSTGADFGSINGFSAASSTGTIVVTCSSGINYNVALDAGLYYDPIPQLRNMQNAGGDTIRYVIAGGTGSGLGGSQWGDQGFGNTFPAFTATSSSTGAPQQMSFDVSVSSGGANTFTAGESYSDTVTITVNF